MFKLFKKGEEVNLYTIDQIKKLEKENKELSKMLVQADRNFEDMQFEMLEILGNLKLLVKSKNQKAIKDYVDNEYNYIKKDLIISGKL